MTLSQPGVYKLSYFTSIIFCSILLIELSRAYILLGQKFTNKQVESRHFNYEKMVMHGNWTRGLSDEAKQQGNTFMVRERVRWTIFQAVISGL
jgi:hypothetical protein